MALTQAQTDCAAEIEVGLTSLYRCMRKYKLHTHRKLGDKPIYRRAAHVERLKGFTPKEERQAL